MKEKILALLVAMFQDVRKDGLNHLANSLALTVKTEDEAKEVVGKLTADQVKTFVTDWRKDADAEIGKANKTYEAGLKAKYDFVEKKNREPAESPHHQHRAEPWTRQQFKTLLRMLLRQLLHRFCGK